MIIKGLWRLLAMFFVGLGATGVVVPGMPTTVFMLLALWASGKGWPRLHDWIIGHPRFGPPLQQWQQQRAVPRTAKWAAGLSMLVSALIIAVSTMLVWIKLSIIIVMAMVFIWLATRPEPSVVDS